MKGKIGFVILKVWKGRRGGILKIIIDANEMVKDIEISIKCNKLTPEVEKIITMLRMFNMQLTGNKGGEIYFIDLPEVLYIDTVDKKTFAYTKEDVYEINLRLYELEKQLLHLGFFRANKSSIINFKHILSLKADIDRRIKVTMSNGERLIISRQYSSYIKERLKV